MKLKEKGEKKMTKLLIAMPTEYSVDALSNLLDEKWEIHTCTDGYATLDAIKYINPEAMILALNMPGKDGLSILKECYPNVPPATLAVSTLINEHIVATAYNLGVKYLHVSPYTNESIKTKLEDMWEKLDRTPVSVILHLRLLGINEALDGYKYLCTAIPFLADDTDKRLHKEVYAYVGQKYNCSIACVEHSIREAIQKAWKSRNNATWSQYFPVDDTGRVCRPSNKRFLATIASRI